MKNFELIAAFEHHGIDKADYFQFTKLVRHGGKVRRGDLASRLMTSIFRRGRYEIMGISATRAA